MRERPIAGLAVSVAIHVALVGAVLLLAAPKATYVTRRGEPLFVELPNLGEPAPRGNPAARTPGPPAAPQAASPPRGNHARTVPRSVPRAVARAETVTKPVAPKPAPAEPRRQAPSKPAEPSKVSSAPADTLAGREPTPPSVPKPAPREAESPASSAEAERRPEPPKAAAVPTPPTQATAQTPGAAPSGAGSQGRQVAMVPPGTPGAREGHGGTGVDIRSAFKRGGGGAGGAADGRGGIEGEPVPLETKDPRYSDYLDRVRRMIKEKWGYPCVREGGARECEYKSAQLIIEFGIAKDGKVPFVNVRRSTGYEVMDEYAVRAVKLASPFPPVPDSLSRKGIPILATFNYIVDTSLVNLLR